MAQDIGLLLRGLGASFSNQVPQFRQEMAQEREAQMRQMEFERQQKAFGQQERMQNVEMMQARRNAAFQDAEVALKLGAMGNWEQVKALLEDRMAIDQELGGSLEGDFTPGLMELARQAQMGNSDAMNQFNRALLPVVAEGKARGVIVPPKSEILPANRVTPQGQVFSQDPSTGEITASMVPGFQAAPALIPEDTTLARTESMRKEFSGIPLVKDFSLQSQAFGRMVASADQPSAAGDMSLVFNFMKVLDPGSTVREGEYANAQNAAGIPDRIRAQYNKIQSGEILTPSQRSDFLSRAQRLYKSAEEGYTKTYNQYKAIAQRQGIPVENALIDFSYPVKSEIPAFFNNEAEAQAATLPSGTVVEIPDPQNPDIILQFKVK